MNSNTQTRMKGHRIAMKWGRLSVDDIRRIESQTTPQDNRGPVECMIIYSLLRANGAGRVQAAYKCLCFKFNNRSLSLNPGWSLGRINKEVVVYRIGNRIEDRKYPLRLKL